VYLVQKLYLMLPHRLKLEPERRVLDTEAPTVFTLAAEVDLEAEEPHRRSPPSVARTAGLSSINTLYNSFA